MTSDQIISGMNFKFIFQRALNALLFLNIKGIHLRDTLLIEEIFFHCSCI